LGSNGTGFYGLGAIIPRISKWTELPPGHCFGNGERISPHHIKVLMDRRGQPGLVLVPDGVIVNRVGGIPPELPAPGLPQPFLADPAQTTRGIELAREA